MSRSTTPSRPVSLRTRLVLAVLLLVTVALGATVTLTRALLVTLVSEEVAQELRGEVAELRLLADEGVDPSTGRRFDDAEALLRLHLGRSIPDPGETMMILLDGTVIARSDDVPAARLDRDEAFVAEVAGLERVVYGSHDTSAGTLRYAAVPVTVAGSDAVGTYVVGIFFDRQAAFVSEVTRALLLVSTVVLGLAGLVAWFGVGRALAPVRAMRQTARSINEANLQGRMVPRHAPRSRLWDELDDLSSTINDMLDRLEVAFAGQRRFLDDAGHELRTPLTVVRGHLELLADDPARLDETVEVVSDELDRMARLVADLQTLTTATQPGFVVPAPARADELVAEILAKAAGLADREWLLDSGPQVVVDVDRHRLTQAMLELAANAVRWTGPGDEIGVGCEVVAGEARFWVRDTGPGVDPELAETLFDRFVHGTGSSGSGLGLSIVAAIAREHHGSARIEPVRPHGARVVLTVPLRTPTGGKQPGGEQPGGEQPGGEQPGGEQPGGKQPGGGQLR